MCIMLGLGLVGLLVWVCVRAPKKEKRGDGEGKKGRSAGGGAGLVIGGRWRGRNVEVSRRVRGPVRMV